MNKYDTLVNILDKLRFEAPLENKRYRPNDDEIEKLNQARSRAFIHLFLKVKFGILDFNEREKLICDGSYDGGIDGYFINTDLKKVYFIQSKFRTNEENFREKEIALDELLKMDVDRITDGEIKDENGNDYNGKIKQIQRDLQNISDIGRYSYEVIILANLRNCTPSDLKKLTNGFAAQVFDWEKTYEELVFPVVSGTYFNEAEIHIPLNLSNKDSFGKRITYNVETTYSECDITVVFVPTIEIAKILYKYKNSILKFNPRCYLELINNTVNKEISKTIKDTKTNEFALFNNGITMLSDGTIFNDQVGKKNTAQMIITNPQIINGGQTAYTLSRLFQDVLDNKISESIFENKEVLVKVITFSKDEDLPKAKKLRLIEDISKATNQQTSVTEADRRANDSIQIELQDIFFKKYGVYYERKKGEFADGLKNKYINRDLLIDRELFLRLCVTCDYKPTQARRSSLKQLFNLENFNKILTNVSRHEEYFFAYSCWRYLNKKEQEFYEDKNNKYGIVNYGHALRVGKFATIAVCIYQYKKQEIALDDVETIANNVLNSWLDFEQHVISLNTNSSYFNTYQDEITQIVKQDLNYDGYYKGRTIDSDIKNYFFK